MSEQNVTICQFYFLTHKDGLLECDSSDQAELEPKVDEGGWDNTSVDLPGFGFKWGDTGAKDSKTNQDAKDKPFFAWF